MRITIGLYELREIAVSNTLRLFANRRIALQGTGAWINCAVG